MYILGWEEFLVMTDRTRDIRDITQVITTQFAMILRSEPQLEEI